MLEDDFGREITGLRVSLTDRCNFDCIYCHNEGLGDTRGPMAPQDDELSTDEVVRVLEAAAEFDISSVKFTGGEPMLRDDLEEIVARTPASIETSLTTNGTFLPGRAGDLANAGIERVNVSIDSLDPETFAEVTRTGAYDRVLEGVSAALDAGLDPVKLNMVVFDDTVTHLEEMVEHVGEKSGLQLQLIEYMPEISGNPEWRIDIDDVHSWLADRADRIETRTMHGRRRYWIEGGMVEIVDPVGNPRFCANCHRLRVTHDGALKGCLNRVDDHVSMGDRTMAEIREAFRTVTAERMPFYGEYMIRDEDGSWVRNEAHRDSDTEHREGQLEQPG